MQAKLFDRWTEAEEAAAVGEAEADWLEVLVAGSVECWQQEGSSEAAQQPPALYELAPDKEKGSQSEQEKKLGTVFPIPPKGDYSVPETCHTAALPSILVGKKQALSHALEIHSYVFCQRGCRATRHAPSQTLHSLQQPGLTLKRFQRKAASHTTEREF